MTEPVKSTLERPPRSLVRRFDISQVGRDTIGTYLEKGWSLALCCKDCLRLVEWTPPDLEARFGTMLELRIADLVPRLSCKGEGGCGSREIAVFPHPYDGEWNRRRR